MFTHRFNQSIDEGEAIHSLFGLDGGANVGLGLSYVPARDFQLAVLRSNVLDTIEHAAKYLVLQQSRAIPLSATIRGGADIRTERETEDRTSFFVQALLSHQFGQRFSVFVAFQPSSPMQDERRAATLRSHCSSTRSTFQWGWRSR